ncbi:MAG: hypothetical protein AAF253_01385 [Pseudomonadota bacterium]
MIPNETTLTAEATAEQSALRSASDLFCEKAEAEGWVSTSPGILGFASILMNGSRDEGEPAGTYADRIDAATATPSDAIAQLQADASTARDGLITVQTEARSLLASSDTFPERLDVTAFERALVRAQRSNRGFREALEIVSKRGEDATGAAVAVDAFSATIDDARRTADALADRYAGKGPESVDAATS